MPWIAVDLLRRAGGRRNVCVCGSVVRHHRHNDKEKHRDNRLSAHYDTSRTGNDKPAARRPSNLIRQMQQVEPETLHSNKRTDHRQNGHANQQRRQRELHQRKENAGRSREELTQPAKAAWRRARLILTVSAMNATKHPPLHFRQEF
jgi:hypothetical protein